MNSPSDQELVEAITKLRPDHPHLGRLKLLSLLKETHSWTLSEQRLKKCLDKNNLNAQPESEGPLPRDEKFNEVVKDAFVDFKTREREFLLALSKPQSEKVSNGYTSDSTYAACHMRHYVEVLLSLQGIKPCTLFAHATAQDIFTEMIQVCLKPVIKKYQLARYGFHLQQITHPMPTTAHQGFQDAWVFADTRSPLWPEVKQVFLTPNKGKADEDRVGKALGYPIDRAVGIASSRSSFCAVDMTEMHDMKSSIHITGYEFFTGTGEDHLADILMHFDRCRRAARDVGTKLEMDLSNNKKLRALCE
ncbi:hypothetical protein LCER1_G004708 [Lachnellula cervina]|uniref:Uncharacterized protein n=1 Tax=Lachnellula cervina TaxID=1316786 RepID=A0A7D8YZN1_9HELO|nr:hypothetical protein LCER1_G004708 [Lachnellula cervina]